MDDKAIYILFIFSILIHNIEEALWLPAWSKSAKKFHKQIKPAEFRFAVLIVTVLAVLSTSAFMFFPGISITKYIYFGFLGAMIVNVFVPHLAATIVLGKYAPGLITGLFLNIPVNGFIIYRSLERGIINLMELFISVAIIGLLLILSLPLLFRLGKLIEQYK